MNIIKPGVGVNFSILKNNTEVIQKFEGSFIDNLYNIIPTNIFKSMADGNILPIILFSLLFGYFITRIKNENKEFLTKFFSSSFKVVMKITMFIISFAPIGIFGIIVKVTAENSENLFTVLQTTGVYMGTVMLALLFHAFISLPILLHFFAKINPIAHFKNMSIPLLTAFSTSSSGATLPLTMEAVENKAGVSNKITSFTLPLGATINMDGTALYECVAAIFIAQLYNIE